MRLLLALALAGVLVVSGCGDDTDSGGGSDQPQPSASAKEATLVGDSGSATVEGGFGEQPSVEVDGEFSVEETDTVVMSKGDGAEVKATDSVLVDYHGVNGTSGETFDSSFERGQPIEFALNEVVPGFSKGLTGQTVGSRVAIKVTSEDGYPEGSSDGAIEPGDSLIFIVDLLPNNKG